MSRVEARTVEYFAIDLTTGREMHVPHITEELAAKWTQEGLHIVTRETRQLVPIFGVLQTVLPEPEPLPVVCGKAYTGARATMGMCGFDPGHSGPCGHGPGFVL